MKLGIFTVLFANKYYDYVVSIEHEDALMSIDEGFARAAKKLNDVLIRDSAVDM